MVSGIIIGGAVTGVVSGIIVGGAVEWFLGLL